MTLLFDYWVLGQNKLILKIIQRFCLLLTYNRLFIIFVIYLHVGKLLDYTVKRQKC